VRLDDQIHRVLLASQHLTGQVVLLGLAVQIAWLDLWIQPMIDAAARHAARQARQARRERLRRRGIPDDLARQDLRLV
jgi:hypothetical protein